MVKVTNSRLENLGRGQSLKTQWVEEACFQPRLIAWGLAVCPGIPHVPGVLVTESSCYTEMWWLECSTVKSTYSSLRRPTSQCEGEGGELRLTTTCSTSFRRSKSFGLSRQLHMCDAHMLLQPHIQIKYFMCEYMCMSLSTCRGQEHPWSWSYR